MDNFFRKLTTICINIVFYPLLTAILTVTFLFCCGIKPYITMSGSMEPKIMTGSICFVDTKADYKEMQAGDIIAFETAAGGLVTHRVISVSSEGLETKGDNNDMSDGISTTAANFRGQTLFSVPYVGYVLKELQQPKNLSIVLIIVAVIFLYNVIDSYWAKKDKEVSEETEEDVLVKARGRYHGKYEAK